MARIISIISGAQQRLPSRAETTDYTLELTDYMVRVTESALTAITLPALDSSSRGHTFVVKKMGSTADVRIVARSGDTIDGAADYSLSVQYQSATLYAPESGTDWTIVVPKVSSGGAPGGSTTQVQYNSAGSFAGAALLSIEAEGLPVVGDKTDTSPAAPSSGATIFARYRAGRRMMAQVGPSGLDYMFQPIVFANKVGWYTVSGNGTVTTIVSFFNATTGTVTTRSVAATNLSTSMRRIAYVSAATAGASCGTRQNQAQYVRGAASKVGGFFYATRFIIDTVTAGMRWFVGLRATTSAIPNVNPSTLTNIFGVGCDSGETTVQFMTNDAAGTATKVDLGASFPSATAAVVYELRVFCISQGTEIFYSLERLDSSALAEGSATSDIPAATQFLSTHIWMNNGGVTASVAVAVVNQYTETDY